MIIKGQITILVSEKDVTIELHDNEAAIQFAQIRLSPENFCAALGRLSHVDCDMMKLVNLESVGKRLEHKYLEFEVPDDVGWGDERKKLCSGLADKACPKGWEHDNYFSSQDTFFEKDGKKYARTTMRRWV